MWKRRGWLCGEGGREKWSFGCIRSKEGVWVISKWQRWHYTEVGWCWSHSLHRLSLSASFSYFSTDSTPFKVQTASLHSLLIFKAVGSAGSSQLPRVSWIMDEASNVVPQLTLCTTHSYLFKWSQTVFYHLLCTSFLIMIWFY